MNFVSLIQQILSIFHTLIDFGEEALMFIVSPVSDLADAVDIPLVDGLIDTILSPFGDATVLEVGTIYGISVIMLVSIIRFFVGIFK